MPRFSTKEVFFGLRFNSKASHNSDSLFPAKLLDKILRINYQFVLQSRFFTLVSILRINGKNFNMIFFIECKRWFEAWAERNVSLISFSLYWILFRFIDGVCFNTSLYLIKWVCGTANIFQRENDKFRERCGKYFVKMCQIVYYAQAFFVHLIPNLDRNK